MFCPGCGTENAEGATFCVMCGARLTEETVESPEKQPAPAAAPRRPAAARQSGLLAQLKREPEDMRQFVDNVVEANTSYLSTGPKRAEVQKALLESHYGKILVSAKAPLDGSPIPLSAELEALVASIRE